MMSRDLCYFIFLRQEKSGSSWSVKSRSYPTKYDGDYETCKGMVPYPTVTPRVCVSPTPSHDVTTRDYYKETAEPVHHMRCSFPSLSPKCSLFRDVSLIIQGFTKFSYLFGSAIDFLLKISTLSRWLEMRSKLFI